MDVRLLRKYRRMVCKKFFLVEEVAVYPRCRYRLVHDKKKSMPCYFLCENGEKIWDEKNKCYQSSIDFDEAQRMLREQRTRYIEYLVANEIIKRCQKIKTKRV